MNAEKTAQARRQYEERLREMLTNHLGAELRRVHLNIQTIAGGSVDEWRKEWADAQRVHYEAGGWGRSSAMYITAPMPKCKPYETLNDAAAARKQYAINEWFEDFNEFLEADAQLINYTGGANLRAAKKEVEKIKRQFESGDRLINPELAARDIVAAYLKRNL